MRDPSKIKFKYHLKSALARQRRCHLIFKKSFIKWKTLLLETHSPIFTVEWWEETFWPKTEDVRVKVSAWSSCSLKQESAVRWEDVSVDDGDETRQREDEWTGCYWQPGALVWGQPCRAKTLCLALESTRGRRTQPDLWPDSLSDLNRPRRVKGQNKCAFSPLSFVLRVSLWVVVSCFSWTFCVLYANTRWVRHWSVGCDWQEEEEEHKIAWETFSISRKWNPPDVRLSCLTVTKVHHITETQRFTLFSQKIM